MIIKLNKKGKLRVKVPDCAATVKAGILGVNPLYVSFGSKLIYGILFCGCAREDFYY